MRAGIVHIVFGVALLVGGYLADTYIEGLYWIGAYIVGGLEILQGVRVIVRYKRMTAG